MDYLKIEGSLVRHIESDAVDRAMVEAIHRVGHIMGLKTVGECVETPEAIAALRAVGVDFAQGYAVQRPQPLPALASVSAPTLVAAVVPAEPVPV